MVSTYKNPDPAYKAAMQRIRAMTYEEKFLAGPRLFDQGCDSLRADIRRWMPQATDEDVEFLIRQCLAYMRRQDG